MFNRVKRRAFVLLLGAACMMSSVASAQISNDRIAIGGVGPGCTPEYVEHALIQYIEQHPKMSYQIN